MLRRTPVIARCCSLQQRPELLQMRACVCLFGSLVSRSTSVKWRFFASSLEYEKENGELFHRAE